MINIGDRNDSVLKIANSLDCIKGVLVAMNKKMKVLKDEADWRKSRYETNFAQENVIAANDSYTTASVNNPNYNRARIQVAAVFATGASGGIEISVVFQNSMVGHVMTMIASNSSSGMISEPIDVKELSSFQVQIFNRDTSKSVTLRRVRIILYNDY